MLGTVVAIATMDISIFDAFPHAIISGVWSIGTCQRGTIVGNQFTKVSDIDVIIDEGSNSGVNTTPESLTSDLLVYVMPQQLPTIRTNKLVSDYMLYDSSEDDYYIIVDAGIGKNQETGYVEHVELKLVQTEIADGQ